MSTRTIVTVILILAVVAFSTALFRDRGQGGRQKGPVPGPDDEPGPPSGALVKSLFEGWDKPAVAVVFSGEMHGYIEPCGCSVNQLGGLSRRADLLRQIGERGWPATTFDGGGLVNNPSRRQGKLKFNMALECLADMHYAGVAMGVEELQLNVDFLVRPQEPPFLSCNLELFGAPDIEGAPQAWRVVTVGGVKIGVTAIFSQRLAEAVAPGVQNGAERDFKVLDPVESLQKALAELDAEHPDLLVLLSHSPFKESKEIAESFPQFDVILTAGGSEDPDPKPAWVAKKTLLVAPGQKGKYVSVVGFFPDAADNRLRFELVALDDKRFHETPVIAERMRSYQEMLKERDLVASDPAIDDPRNIDPLTSLPLAADDNPYVGGKICGECHKSAWNVWETSKHAQATETLITGGARGTKSWINRMFDPECIACHVTGWDPKRFIRYKTGFQGEPSTPQLAGQSCENCHGPGGRHSALERDWAKDQKTTEELTAWRKFHRLSVKTARDLCLKCHDGDNDPEFDTEKKSFARYWDEIAHPGKD